MMAYAYLPTPGDEFLCAEPCNHTDCAESRRLLNEACRHCGDQMQSGERYVQDERNSDRIVHWSCAVAAADATEFARAAYIDTMALEIGVEKRNR